MTGAAFKTFRKKTWYNNKMKNILKYYIYIYIYAFRRRFYPKRLTVHSGYTFFCQYVCSLGTIYIGFNNSVCVCVCVCVCQNIVKIYV